MSEYETKQGIRISAVTDRGHAEVSIILGEGSILRVARKATQA